MSYVELHLHSQFSILDSTASISKIVEKAKSIEMSSVALTDHGNLFGIVEFYKACQKNSIHPIIGAELLLAPNSRMDKKKVSKVSLGGGIVLLAENRKGYQNLCKLSSIGYLEGFYYYPRIDKEVLAQHTEGLICLSGSTYSYLSLCVFNKKQEEVEKELEWFSRHFPDRFYLELQRHEMDEEMIHKDHMHLGRGREVEKHRDFVKDQERIIEVFIDLGKKFSIPLVATNDVHYIERDDYISHEILLSVQSGKPYEIWERTSNGDSPKAVLNPKREMYFSHEFYFKSPDEMQKLFSDLPEAVTNTKKISERCCCALDFKTKHYPVYIPDHLEGKEISKEEREKEAERYLYQLCVERIEKRYTPERLSKIKEIYPNEDSIEVVKKRLKYEFEVLSSKGMCDYLLIVFDFIHWAKQKGIPVGPGRGSVAGSIISYLIGITDIEPLRFHLFFERFINPERISYPDIDVDICMERRSEVIDYTIQKYGKDKVAQIITFGTMKAKMAIKDVGRVLSIPLAEVNEITSLVPEDPNITLDEALYKKSELKERYEKDGNTKKIINFAKKLEGSIRNVGIHAAGLIVCKDPLTDHIPVCTAKDADIVMTQYAMNPVESVGMLKIDFLGLKTLSAIQKAVESIKKNHHVKVDLSNLDLEDGPCFNLLNNGRTLGVFQLESRNMRELARRLHIDHFEEIIALVALYRPGPMEMIDSFIARKHGWEPIEIEHPLMKDILNETYGIMVYQEQVMQIAEQLAGYSLGEGDVLRRAMGKKDKGEMQRQRKKFLEGAKKKKITEKVAVTVFDKIEKFASYGFNKSHAAAYAYLSYVTAYLKANFPKEWMSALMTCDYDDLSKVTKLIRECITSMQIRILPPDINESSLEFCSVPEGIRFAMNGIKGIGTSCVEAIIEERERNGSFQNLNNFLQRVDKTRVTKKNIELLIDSGGFDFTKWSRDALKCSVDQMYEQELRQQKEDAKGVMNLFSLLDEKEHSSFTPPNPEKISSREEIQLREENLLGFYLTGDFMGKSPSLPGRSSCTFPRHSKPLPEEEKQIKSSHLRIVLDADRTRLSQIMQIKKLFRENQGRSSVNLSFYSGNKNVGNVEISPYMGVTINHFLEETLKKFSVVISVESTVVSS